MTALRAELARAHRERQAKFYPTRPAPGIVALRAPEPPPPPPPVVSPERQNAVALYRKHVVTRPKSDERSAAQAAAIEAQIDRLEKMLKEARAFASTDSVVPFVRTRATLRDILAAASAYYSVAVLDIVSQRRTRNIARPRQVVMYLARTMTPLSMPQIGRYLGDRDHTTVLHAVRVIEKRLQEDGQLQEDVTAIKGIVADILQAGAEG